MYYPKTSLALARELGLVGITDLTQIVGVARETIRQRIKAKLIPSGISLGGKDRYFPPSQVEEIKQYFEKVKDKNLKEQEGLFTLTTTARILGVTPGTLQRGIDLGQIDPPTIRIGTRLFWRVDQLPTIKKQFESMPPVQHESWYTTVQRDQEYLSVKAMARAINIPAVTFGVWLRNKGVPKPSHLYRGKLWYIRSEVEKIRTYFLQNGYKVGKRGPRKGPDAE